MREKYKCGGDRVLAHPAPSVPHRKEPLMLNNDLEPQGVPKVAPTDQKNTDTDDVRAAIKRVRAGYEEQHAKGEKINTDDPDVFSLPVPEGLQFTDGHRISGIGLAPLTSEDYGRDGFTALPIAARVPNEETGELSGIVIMVLPKDTNEAASYYFFLLKMLQEKPGVSVPNLWDFQGDVRLWAFRKKESTGK